MHFYISFILVLDIDVTLFDINPLVNITSNTPQYDYRSYVPWRQNNATYKIGRAGYTGTGEVGVNRHDVIETKGSDFSIPEGKGFPRGTRTRYYEIPGSWTTSWKYERLDAKFPRPPTIQSLGVFYIDTYYNGKNIVLSTIKISKSGK